MVAIAMNDYREKPDSYRALEAMTLQAIGNSIQETADLLCVHRNAVGQQNTKWLDYYCGHGDHRRMSVVLVLAIDDGTRKRLLRKFINHKIIGPVIKKWRERK